MAKSTKRLGEILMEKGLISQDQLAQALSEQRSSGKFLGTILMEKGLISEQQFIAALSEQFGLPVVDLKEQHIDMELARKFSTSVLTENKCFPLKEDDYTLTMAIANPLNVVGISKIEEEASPRKVNLVLCSEQDLNKVLQNYHQYVSQGIQRLLKRKPAEGGPEKG